MFLKYCESCFASTANMHFHQFRLPLQSLLSLLSPMMMQSDFYWVSKQRQTAVGKMQTCSLSRNYALS